MSAQFETFSTELRALVVAVWPDATAVWEQENLDLVPWEQTTPPIANIEIGAMPVSADWGIANEVHEGTITLTWVGATTGDSSTQRARAEAMRDALLSATFTAANVLDVSTVDWSDTLPVNRTFYQKGMLFRAVQVQASVIVAADLAV